MKEKGILKITAIVHSFYRWKRGCLKLLEMYTMYEFELINYVNINYLKLLIILRKLKVIAQVDFQISLT